MSKKARICGWEIEKKRRSGGNSNFEKVNYRLIFSRFLQKPKNLTSRQTTSFLKQQKIRKNSRDTQKIW